MIGLAHIGGNLVGNGRWRIEMRAIPLTEPRPRRCTRVVMYDDLLTMVGLDSV